MALTLNARKGLIIEDFFLKKNAISYFFVSLFNKLTLRVRIILRIISLFYFYEKNTLHFFSFIYNE